MAQLMKREFVAWLSAKPAEEVVGKAQSRMSCPLASYLSETERPPEGAWIEVDGETWDMVSRREIVTHRMPRWAAQFVTTVDELRPSERITAADALAIVSGAGRV